MNYTQFINNTNTRKKLSEDVVHRIQCDTTLQMNIDDYLNRITYDKRRGVPTKFKNYLCAFLNNPCGNYESFYERYLHLTEFAPHTLDFLSVLYGKDRALEMYCDRSANMSKKLSLDTDSLVKNFIDKHQLHCVTDEAIINLKKIIELINPRQHDDANLIKDLIKFKDGYDRYIKIKKHRSSSPEYSLLRFNTLAYYENIRAVISNTARRNFSSCEEYWRSCGYTSQEEIKSKISQAQSIRSNKRDRSNEYSTRSVEYWTSRGLTIEAAKQKVSQMQSRDINFFKGKFGKEWKYRYTSMLDKRLISWNKRPAEEKSRINQTRGKTYLQLVERHGLERARAILRSRTSNNDRSSKEANLFFHTLDSKFAMSKDSVSGYKGDEYFVFTDTGIYFVDYIYKNRIIEYYGSFYHCDPRLFEHDQINGVTKLSASVIWERDEKRINALRQRGYCVKVVWSEDIKVHGLHHVIEECLEFLYD